MITQPLLVLLSLKLLLLVLVLLVLPEDLPILRVKTRIIHCASAIQTREL